MWGRKVILTRTNGTQRTHSIGAVPRNTELHFAGMSTKGKLAVGLTSQQLLPPCQCVSQHAIWIVYGKYILRHWHCHYDNAMVVKIAGLVLRECIGVWILGGRGGLDFISHPQTSNVKSASPLSDMLCTMSSLKHTQCQRYHE